jgi:sorbitol-6-phosphate 2-dehydrogenase
MTPRDCQKLKGLAAIVTGAGRGIGEALAVRLAEEGCAVAVSDVDADAAERLARALPDAIWTRCDVTVPAECDALARQTAEKYGRIDLLVSNAGILISGAIGEIGGDDWKKVVDVNLCGCFNICKAVVPYMKKQGKGSIVQINSKSGKKGSYKNSAYAASKFGGIGLVQSLALELAEAGIRVNAICPGNLMNSPLWTDSLNGQYAKNRGMTKEEAWDFYNKQVPLGRTCEYEDVANMAVYLLGDEAGYITGQAINVTGGFEMR